MVEVRYQARLGNNLFQYCFGRLLAERLGFELAAEPIDGFPGTAERVAGVRVEGPEQRLTGQQVDLDAILADRTPRRLVVDGWFQRYDYYRPLRDQIRQWLAFDSSVSGPAAPPDTVLHIRRTDYVTLGWALPFSFYERAMERLSPSGPVWIVTDDPADPFFRRFESWRPRFANGTALEDLRLMCQARQIVMSQSTYSWWPTFLGTPGVVICPTSSFGPWATQGGPAEANLIERDRFICLDSDEPYRPDRREQGYQQRRAWRRRVVLAVNRRLGWSLTPPPQ
jgi:hypothetical protein